MPLSRLIQAQGSRITSRAQRQSGRRLVPQGEEQKDVLHQSHVRTGVERCIQTESREGGSEGGRILQDVTVNGGSLPGIEISRGLSVH